MFNESVLKKKFPIVDGIYNCLDDATYTDRIKKVEIATYSERADAFDEEKMLNLSVEHKECLAPFMDLPQGSLILEVGGGDGRFAFYLLQHGLTVIESDIAPGSVQKVKSVAEKHHIPNGVFAIIDAEHLPFNDQTLDGIFMVASLHHLANPDQAIAEFNRCLKKGRHLLILREPASWQYKLFKPLFWLIRTIVRKKNKNPVSLADDETWGFTVKQYQQLFSHFDHLTLNPVSYLYKYYYNVLLLMNKFRREPIKENGTIKRILQDIDVWIGKVPIIKNYPWDWDVCCRKK